MASPSLKIPLRLARPGMRLAAEVTMESGMLLFPVETELDEARLSRLHQMGVESLQVTARGPWLKEIAALPACRQEGQRLVKLFRRHGDDPWMRQVRGVLLAHGSLKAAARELGSTEGGDVPQEVDA